MTRLRDDLTKIRQILMEKSKSWGELMELTALSPSVLKNRLDLLINRDEVETEVGKRKNRRTTLYKLVDSESSRKEVRRYKLVKFVESVENIRVGEAEDQIGKLKLISSILTDVQGLTKEDLDQRCELLNSMMGPAFEQMLSLVGDVPEHFKLIYALTFEQ